ncbi:DUF1016 N-terminal domain-containing protein [Belliella sp. R4-6]|uniref:DUF1016 N-terminal domain-containing protein n=1 Tax=Belliella alkalica TaxID=1730871 RepID=A0ABS9VBN4_9BACT|nr:DUF1016 N-terminal domain-containing protein [Belliella alkalica]MCH7413851.1 DUF1016 N-terminal domain-containing protein [Belliella alkalica]
MSELNSEYKKCLVELKSRIRSSQIKSVIAVNNALIEFYWHLGKMISEKENVWGSKLIEQVAKDLQSEFPEMKGLSRRNLFNCKQFYKFYSSQLVQQPVALNEQEAKNQSENSQNEQFVLVQQLVSKIPWGHNIYVFTKSKDVNEAIFYI